MPDQETKWVLTTTPCREPSKIAFGNGRFVEVGSGSNGAAAASSEDGALWFAGHPSTSYMDNEPYTDVKFGGGRFVAVSPKVQSHYSYMPISSDGITWDNIVSPVQDLADASGNAHSLVFGANRFLAFFLEGPPIAVEYRYHVYFSEDSGSTWSKLSEPPGVITLPVYANGNFVGFRGSTAYISRDGGATWAQTGIGDSESWSDSVYADGKIIVVAKDSDKIRYSENDGITWKEAVLPFSDAWTGIAYGSGKYVVISEAGNVVFSTDGKKWRQAESLPEVPGKLLQSPSAGLGYGKWVSIAYGNGRFAAAHNYGAARHTEQDHYPVNEEFCAYIVVEDLKPLRNIRLWAGVDGKARKAARMWVGVDGKAREAAAGWVGVDGKARRFF